MVCYRESPDSNLPLIPTSVQTGIEILQADDLETWIFTIEVLGESQYKVRHRRLVLGVSITHLFWLRARGLRSNSASTEATLSPLLLFSLCQTTNGNLRFILCVPLHPVIPPRSNSNITQHVYTNGHVRGYPPCGALNLISSSHN